MPVLSEGMERKRTISLCTTSVSLVREQNVLLITELFCRFHSLKQHLRRLIQGNTRKRERKKCFQPLLKSSHVYAVFKITYRKLQYNFADLE